MVVLLLLFLKRLFSFIDVVEQALFYNGVTMVFKISAPSLPVSGVILMGRSIVNLQLNTAATVYSIAVNSDENTKPSQANSGGSASSETDGRITKTTG